MGPEQRGMWVIESSLFRKSWIIRSASEVNGVFAIIRKAARTAKDRRSVKWFRGRVLGHLASDYSNSAFLERIGRIPVTKFAVVTVCGDGKLIVEQLVVTDDSSIVDRDECNMEDGNRIPTTDEIRQACQKIRAKRPVCGYHARWVGAKDPGIREINLMEDINVNC